MDLPRVLAADPVAAARAFHVHVVLFLTHLLGCQAPSSFPSFAHLSHSPLEGVLGHVSAYYGVTEPQNRCSLHIHFLLHLTGFVSPQALLHRFADHLPELSAALLQWAASLQHTSIEALPNILAMPQTAHTLSHLQPLPFSRAHRASLGAAMADFLHLSQTHWYAADPARLLPVQASSEAWFDPFDDVAQALPPCLSWPRAYLDAASPPPAVSWTNMLLYDVRHTVVQCGLHECRPATCWKGFLGRIHYCRLGFWHWAACPERARAWRRVHGHALRARCDIGTLPPSRGLLLPERHHPFMGKLNAALLVATKSNHDVGLLLRAPPPDTDLTPTTYLQFMVTNLRTTTFYVTNYSSKVQPQLTNLWTVLQSGHAALEAEIASLSEPLPPLAHASRVCIV